MLPNDVFQLKPKGKLVLYKFLQTARETIADCNADTLTFVCLSYIFLLTATSVLDTLRLSFNYKNN